MEKKDMILILMFILVILSLFLSISNNYTLNEIDEKYEKAVGLISQAFVSQSSVNKVLEEELNISIDERIEELE
ncbi:hypothetical protein HN865_04800 [Candidatus Woesearchaeota archaeon]|jgi:hypothetical protein|nr:hypothetical protein [archaeon]MBT7238142.1 hypothetical protein [Candidatus Woesearchaeota archaeon]